MGQDCACPPILDSQPVPTAHMEKHRVNTADCKKGVEKGLAPWEMCDEHHNEYGNTVRVQLYGLQYYLRGESGLRCVMIYLAGQPGGALIVRNGFYWA